MVRLADSLLRAGGARRFRGFSLIELMVVVAVIAILASIVYPAYENLIQRVRRADGRATAMAIAQAQERFFTVNGRYFGPPQTPSETKPSQLFGTAASQTDASLKCNGCAWASCDWTQCASAKGYYSLLVTSNTVTVSRIPLGQDPTCTAMTIALRTGIQGGTGSDPAKCW